MFAWIFDVGSKKQTEEKQMRENFSLLYPADKEPAFETLSDTTCNDLSLEFICDSISESEYEQNVIKRMMRKFVADTDVIKYRCDIFEDIINFPELRNRIKELLEELDYLKDLEKSVKDNTAAPIWQLINRLQELDVYVNCISGINEALTNNPIKSEGLKELKEFVSSVYNESGFENLYSDIKSLTYMKSGSENGL